jgi:hypothetical protein
MTEVANGSSMASRICAVFFIAVVIIYSGTNDI